MADDQVVDLQDDTLAGYLGGTVGRAAKFMHAPLLAPSNPKKLLSTIDKREAQRILAEMKEKYPDELAQTKVQLGGHDMGEVFRRTWNDTRQLPGFRHLDAVTSPLIGLATSLGRADHYNPTTDTVTVYSDSPGILRHELGHAVDHNAKLKMLGGGLGGSVAKEVYDRLPMTPIGELPGYALWPEAQATGNALSTIKNPEEQEEAWDILAPAYGTYAGGAAVALRRLGMMNNWWGGPVGRKGLLTDLGLFYGSMLAGHGAAGLRNWLARRKRERETAEE